MVSRSDVLVLMPTLGAAVFADGTIGLTAKFVDGVDEYIKYWNGRVRVLMEPSKETSVNLDNVRLKPASLSFELKIVDFMSDELAEHLRDAAIVHCSASHRQNHIADLCNSIGVASVYGTEYSLRTRMQIIGSEASPMTAKLRRSAWAIRQELRQRRAIGRATGVQCNGTPTFDAYARLSRNPHLYFDTRTRAVDLIAPDRLEARLAELGRAKKLRLVFSGRLDRMKGTNALPAIAEALRKQGVDFELSICGDGELAQSMAADIERLSLGQHVSMKGVLDFRSELVPFVKEHVDVFVCTHVQGDPSCTYLETFACGVPIVGYANEAFAGLLKRVQGGWPVAVNDAEGMAQKLAELSRQRETIAKASHNALQFAALHSFEATFEGRVKHFRECQYSLNARMTA